MRPSPIQLRHVIYERVMVRPHAGEHAPDVRSVEFDFQGVNIRAVIGAGLKQGQESDPRDFIIRLAVVIDNKEGKKAPYDIDIGIAGMFNVLPSLPIERREDLVTVNGASILYGVIREIVLSLTSRFSKGSITLPGMNFEDNAPSRQSKQIDPAKASRLPPAQNKRKLGTAKRIPNTT